MSLKRSRLPIEPSNTVIPIQLILSNIPSDISESQVPELILSISKSLGLVPPIRTYSANSNLHLIFQTVANSVQSFKSFQSSASFPSEITIEYGESKFKAPERAEWTCTTVISTQCDSLNFANRLKCYKCSKNKSIVHQENIKATIMVRGISQFSETEIWESFERIGKVKDVRRVKDRFTGEFKDFGFVEFESEMEADVVIEVSLASSIRINGRPVSVCKSKNKKAENFVQDKDNPNYGYGIPIEPVITPGKAESLSWNEGGMGNYAENHTSSGDITGYL